MNLFLQENQSDEDDDDDDDNDEEEDTKPEFESVSLKHLGGVNRIRVSSSIVFSSFVNDSFLSVHCSQ